MIPEIKLGVFVNLNGGIEAGTQDLIFSMIDVLAPVVTSLLQQGEKKKREIQTRLIGDYSGVEHGFSLPLFRSVNLSISQSGDSLRYDIRVFIGNMSLTEESGLLELVPEMVGICVCVLFGLMNETVNGTRSVFQTTPSFAHFV
jgi:hypothetical protein